MNEAEFYRKLQSISTDEEYATLADPECPHCRGKGVLPGEPMWVDWGSTKTMLPDNGEVCDCVLDGLEDEHDEELLRDSDA